mmetsp:Transcript_24940/g.63249  ORF Transcript_24940/g.63249 Transcript_24940/m.63249 type:complete len:272 (-) Transcript_24940:238-1053(-)
MYSTSSCWLRASGLVILKGVRTPPYRMRACSISCSRRSMLRSRSSFTASPLCSTLSARAGAFSPASTSAADSRSTSEPYCVSPLSSELAPAEETWALTSAALNCSMSSAPIAASFVWSEPNMAMATSGSTAPACTIERRHCSASARVPSAEAAEVCRNSYTPSERAAARPAAPCLSMATRTGTAPIWQIAAWWPLSSVVVGSSSASACRAPAPRYFAWSEPSRISTMILGTTPERMAALRKVVGWNIDPDEVCTAICSRRAIAASLAVAEP